MTRVNLTKVATFTACGPIVDAAATTWATAYTESPATRPYSNSSIPKIGTNKGKRIIWLAPKIALIPIAAAIWDELAFITGATTATAELPQIEFPTPTRVANFFSNLNILWPTKYEINIEPDIPIIIINNIFKPLSIRSGKKMLAPINMTENSNICFPANFALLSNDSNFGINVTLLIVIPKSNPTNKESINDTLSILINWSINIELTIKNVITGKYFFIRFNTE